jgi:hypothetical protein
MATTADALLQTLTSENFSGNMFNTADAVMELANVVRALKRAVAADASPGTDHYGGRVSSLTEAVMGMTYGLSDIASSIRELAEAVRESK